MQSTNQGITKCKFFAMSEYKQWSVIEYLNICSISWAVCIDLWKNLQWLKWWYSFLQHFYLIVIFPIKIFLYISEPNLTLKFLSRFLLSLHCLISSRQIFSNLICNTRCHFFQTDFEAVLFVYTTPNKQFRCNIA